MLKNVNDYITLLILLMVSGYGLRIFLGTLSSHRNDDTPRQKRRQMVREYLDNIED